VFRLDGLLSTWMKTVVLRDLHDEPGSRAHPGVALRLLPAPARRVGDSLVVVYLLAVSSALSTLGFMVATGLSAVWRSLATSRGRRHCRRPGSGRACRVPCHRCPGRGRLASPLPFDAPACDHALPSCPGRCRDAAVSGVAAPGRGALPRSPPARVCGLPEASPVSSGALRVVGEPGRRSQVVERRARPRMCSSALMSSTDGSDEAEARRQPT
jgi:hypothetical protein